MELKPYNPTHWIDHVVDQEGHIIQQGTPLDQAHMNNIEEGITNLDTAIRSYDDKIKEAEEAVKKITDGTEGLTQLALKDVTTGKTVYVYAKSKEDGSIDLYLDEQSQREE